jgi:ribosome-associated translation inhibitor RaiA
MGAKWTVFIWEMSMALPLQISFQDFDPSDAVRARIREEAEKLEHYCDRIISFRVVVSEPHRHHHKGRIFNVKLFIALPGGHEVVVNKLDNGDHAHEDVYVTIRDAFAAAKRQLADHLCKHRDH